MRIILQPSLDPAFNLAVEEVLLARESEDVFMLWRNAPAVVIGRNQDAWAEVDLAYAKEHGIAVVRRLSGGGAVYHDEGNVNFTFIAAATGDGVDFRPFTEPIIRALAALGVQARLDGRNDILAGDAKISGNAQCTYRRPDGTSRLLHHGTLLLATDMTPLGAVLRPRPEKLRSRGIASVRSRVTNLTALPGFPKMSAEAFMEYLAKAAVEGGGMRPLTAEECACAEALKQSRYGTWEWNYGASAAHERQLSARFPFGILSAAYSARGGRITSVRLNGDYFGTEPVSYLEAALTGAALTPEDLVRALSGAGRPVAACIHGADATMIAALILGEYEQDGEVADRNEHGE